MAEGINSTTPFASGGHVWVWQPRKRVDKRIIAAGTAGEGRMVTHLGGKQAIICGRPGPGPGGGGSGVAGGPALLCASDANRAAADTAMNALESAIEALADSGAAYAYEDDQGHTGTHLVVLDYRRVGPRQYGVMGSAHECWQYYTAIVEDLDG
jgi:hypothetical protein